MRAEYALSYCAVTIRREFFFYYGDSNGSVPRKYKFTLLELLHDHSKTFNLNNVAKLFSNRISRNGVQVKTKYKKN